MKLILERNDGKILKFKSVWAYGFLIYLHGGIENIKSIRIKRGLLCKKIKIRHDVVQGDNAIIAERIAEMKRTCVPCWKGGEV